MIYHSQTHDFLTGIFFSLYSTATLVESLLLLRRTVGSAFDIAPKKRKRGTKKVTERKKEFKPCPLIAALIVTLR